MADTIAQIQAAELAEKVYDAGDPASVNEARKRAGRRKVKERETLSTLMQYENGRRFLYDSIKCIIEGDPLVPGDPYSTYFNLGQERRAREIFQEILKVSPKGFGTMIEEQAQDQ